MTRNNNSSDSSGGCVGTRNGSPLAGGPKSSSQRTAHLGRRSWQLGVLLLGMAAYVYQLGGGRSVDPVRYLAPPVLPNGEVQLDAIDDLDDNEDDNEDENDIDAVNSDRDDDKDVESGSTTQQATATKSNTNNKKETSAVLPDPRHVEIPEMSLYDCSEALRFDFRGFLKGDTDPVPVILLSLAGSGSTMTWRIMSHLTGMERGVLEYPGPSVQKAVQFYEKHQDDDKGHWIMDFMKRSQRRNPKAGMVGFWWKPFGETLYASASICALQMLASTYGAKNIRVVRMRRNLLDVLLSMIQQSQRRRRGQGPGNDCPGGGGGKCPNNQAIDLRMSKLQHFLPKMTADEKVVDYLLSELGVPHISVTYEKLYHREGDAHEWMRIFRFLRRGPDEGLSMEQIHAFMASSSPDSVPRSHKEAIQNYDTVRQVLDGTPYAHLLH